MNNYLIPANSKKSQLIFSIFRGIDLIILLLGASLSLILFFAISGDTVGALFIKFLPIGLSLLLIMPLPYYHNVLVFLQEFYIYMMRPKQYYWRGWCATYEFSSDSDDSAKKEN